VQHVALKKRARKKKRERRKFPYNPLKKEKRKEWDYLYLLKE